MIWILVITLYAGGVHSISFNTSSACVEASKTWTSMNPGKGNAICVAKG